MALLLILSLLQYVFLASFKIGQFIVTSALKILQFTVLVLKHCAITFNVISEDFVIFFEDVIQKVELTVYFFIAVVEYAFNTVDAVFFNFIPNLLQYCVFICNSAVELVYSIVNFVKNLVILIIKSFVLFQEGVWFIIAFLPYSIGNFVSLLPTYAKNSFDISCKYVMYKISWSYNTIEECVKYFVNEISLESVLGLFVSFSITYLLVQFYLEIVMFLHNTLWTCYTSLKRLIYRTIRRLSMWITDSFFQMMTFILVRSRTISPFTAFPRTRTNIEQPQMLPTPPREMPLQERDEILCIICQERQKSIVLLKCKHLCLCGICMDELLRRSRIPHCPVCREVVQNYLSVYL